MTPEQQVEQLRASAQRLHDVLMTYAPALPQGVHPAIQQWRRDWMFHTGTGLLVDGQASKPDVSRAHSYERDPTRG